MQISPAMISWVTGHRSTLNHCATTARRCGPPLNEDSKEVREQYLATSWRRVLQGKGKQVPRPGAGLYLVSWRQQQGDCGGWSVKRSDQGNKARGGHGKVFGLYSEPVEVFISDDMI